VARVGCWTGLKIAELAEPRRSRKKWDAGLGLPTMILLEKIRLIWFRVSELFNDLIRSHASLPAQVSW
jgi:hypothetical protein